MGEILIVDYLLFRLNLSFASTHRSPPSTADNQPFYVKYFKMDGPTEDVKVFLEAVARRLGLIRKGGTFDAHLAAIRLLRMYNEGFFGSFSLD